MVTNVLVGVSLLVTLLGVVGIREKTVKKRMLALGVTTVGSLGVAFAQMGEYGLISGFQQLPFRLLGLMLFLLLMNSVCKKNEIGVLEELNGVRRFMPYTYALLVLLAMFLVGVPGTGTFTGMMYAQMGYMYAKTGVLSYVGMVGNLASLIVTAMIIFPILREAFLYEKKEIVNGKSVSTEPAEKKQFASPGKALKVVTALLVVAMLVFSVWQDATTTAVTKLINLFM